MSALGCPSTSCHDCPQAYLCHCLRVTEDEVRLAVNLKGLTTVGEIRKVTEAGTGCNACHRRIQAVIDSSHEERHASHSGHTHHSGGPRHPAHPELVVLGEAV